jgi:hypothetical protein
MKLSLTHSLSASAGALLTSSATLVCCVLPAVLVSLGAGATLASLVSTFPQLIWLSEHKIAVFAIAGVMLLGSGVLLRNARQLPCPTEPRAARACTRLRKISHWLYAVALISYLAGVAFAFAIPWLLI